MYISSIMNPLNCDSNDIHMPQFLLVSSTSLLFSSLGFSNLQYSALWRVHILCLTHEWYVLPNLILYYWHHLVLFFHRSCHYFSCCVLVGHFHTLWWLISNMMRQLLMLNLVFSGFRPLFQSPCCRVVDWLIRSQHWS